MWNTNLTSRLSMPIPKATVATMSWHSPCIHFSNDSRRTPAGSPAWYGHEGTPSSHKVWHTSAGHGTMQRCRVLDPHLLRTLRGLSTSQQLALMLRALEKKTARTVFLYGFIPTQICTVEKQNCRTNKEQPQPTTDVPQQTGKSISSSNSSNSNNSNNSSNNNKHKQQQTTANRNKQQQATTDNKQQTANNKQQKK